MFGRSVLLIGESERTYLSVNAIAVRESVAWAMMMMIMIDLPIN